MDVIAVITARGSSKGMVRKNVLPLAGKPLIAWTICAALESNSFTRIIVSTDDEEIAQVSREWGADVPFTRPSQLAQDDSEHVDVVEHAIQWLEKNENICPDYVMLLQPTSPLRTAVDIRLAIEMAQANDAIAVISACESDCHPVLSKRILDDGTLSNFFSSGITASRRQLLQPAYAVNGAIYLNHRKSFLSQRTFWPQGSYAYIMPAERSVDVDMPWDFSLAELILRDRFERNRI
jgi:CMP-N,N'-diacetyllegionaminic acid synthase